MLKIKNLKADIENKSILNNCTHLLSTIGPISGYDPVLKFHRNEIKTSYRNRKNPLGNRNHTKLGVEDPIS